MRAPVRIVRPTKRIELGDGGVFSRCMTDEATGRPCLCLWVGDWGKRAGDWVAAEDMPVPTRAPDVVFVARADVDGWEGCSVMIRQFAALASYVSSDAGDAIACELARMLQEEDAAEGQALPTVDELLDQARERIRQRGGQS